MSAKYYNVSSASIELMLNWGPIMFIATIPLVMYLADAKVGGGLRRVVLTSAVLQAVGTGNSPPLADTVEM